MRRAITMLECLFLILLVAHIWKWSPRPPLYVAFIPLLISIAMDFWAWGAPLFGWQTKMGIRFYNIIIDRRIRKGQKKAAKIMADAYQAGQEAAKRNTNPGQVNQHS